MKTFVVIATLLITILCYRKIMPNFKGKKLLTTKSIKFVRYSQSISEQIDILNSEPEIEALVDNRKRDYMELLNETNNKSRSFPRQRFMVQGKTPSYNSSCANYPTLYNIKFDGNWQVMDTPNGSAFLYGAYLDNRNLTYVSRHLRGPVVRILGMIEYSLSFDTKISYFCQLWFHNQTKPLFSPVTRKMFHRTYKGGKHRLFLFSCNLAKLKLGFNELPESVSLVIAKQIHVTMPQITYAFNMKNPRRRKILLFASKVLSS